MKKTALFLMLLIVILGCRAQNNERMSTVRYSQAAGDDDQLSLDIYPIKSGTHLPVIVFVHGGAWILGDKSTKIDDKIRLFHAQNYVLVSVNYRLSSFFNTKVQYPSHPNDVADAVKWIYDHISAYGGNPDEMVLMGHSAGAQIVSLLGTSDDFLPKRGIALDKIKGIISNDTEGYDVTRMGSDGVKIYRRIFGDSAEVWKNASPLHQISANKAYPKFLVITRGQAYRKTMSQEFVSALKSAGANAELISADPYSHFEANNKIGAENETVITPKILDFLAQCFR